jgi:hypothetical protein
MAGCYTSSSTSNQGATASLEKPKFVKRPLTKKLIDKYKLTIEDLSQVQYFLKDSLIIKKRKEEVKKSSTNDLDLAVMLHVQPEMVIIGKETPGFAVRIYKKWQEEGSIFKKLENSISSERENIIMRVSFEENNPSKFITFEPANTDSGEYVIQTVANDSAIFYAGAKYYGGKGVHDNALLFNVWIQDTETDEPIQNIAGGLRLRRTKR